MCGDGCRRVEVGAETRTPSCKYLWRKEGRNENEIVKTKELKRREQI
jgi:hypothetical protein